MRDKAGPATIGALLLLSLLVLNLHFRHHQPGGCALSSSDSQYNMIMAGGVPGAGTMGLDLLPTYGPLFPYLAVQITPFDAGGHYWPVLLLGLLLAAVLALFASRAEAPAAPWILCAYFALYEFPWLGYAPFILLPWAVSLPGERWARTGHLLLGAAISAVNLLYKPSAGIACAMQVAAVAACHPGLGAWRERLRWTLLMAGAGLGMSLALYVATTGGTPLDFARFLVQSLADTGGYSEIMTGAWQRDLVLVRWYGPLAVLFLLALACVPVHGRRGWVAAIVFPLLFVEFKHSYVRADPTTLQYVFWMLPLAAFFLLLGFWRQRALRILLLVVLGLSTAADLAGFTPHNIPWRHPRQVWLRTPGQFEAASARQREQATAALANHLDGFSWLRQEAAGQDLLSIPMRPALALAADRPVFLPGLVAYYYSSGDPKVALDLQLLRERPPALVLFEDANLDQRGPLDGHVAFAAELLSRYDRARSEGDFHLFRRRDAPRPLARRPLAEARLEEGRGLLRFSAPTGTPLVLSITGVRDLAYRLKVQVLKGDRLEFSWKRGTVARDYTCDFRQLEQGIFLLPEPRRLFSGAAAEEQGLDLQGGMMQRFPHDPASALFSRDPPLAVRVEALVPP